MLECKFDKKNRCKQFPTNIFELLRVLKMGSKLREIACRQSRGSINNNFVIAKKTNNLVCVEDLLEHGTMNLKNVGIY